MWTTHNRKRYDRSRLRYPSDLTDDAKKGTAVRGGTSERVDLRITHPKSDARSRIGVCSQ